MGAWNFIVDMSQEGRLGDHDDEIANLKKDMETARLWIEHLNGRLSNFESMFKHMPPEAMSEEEKRAYCFGWFKAIEVERLGNKK